MLQHTDTSKGIKATLECCYALAWAVSQHIKNNNHGHNFCIIYTDTSKNSEATLKCCALQS